MELKIDVLQDANAMKEHKVDIKVSTIIGTEAKTVKQVSSWKPAWVRVDPRAAPLTPNTAANTSDELSWDRAMARSLAGGTATYLVLDTLDIANDIEELIERIGHNAVAENLNDVMNSTNSELSSEEPELVWTVLCQAMTQKSVRKADTNRTDQDSKDQKCFSCVTVRAGHRVIDFECTKKDVIALSAIQCESYSRTTGELGRGPSEHNETDLGTKYLERDRIERCMTKMGMMIVGAWAGEQLLVVSCTGVIIGQDLIEGHSWTMGVVLLVTVGVGLLNCVCCVRSAPANWKCTCDKRRTRGRMAAERHDFEKHAKRDHQPLKRD